MSIFVVAKKLLVLYGVKIHFAGTFFHRLLSTVKIAKVGMLTGIYLVLTKHHAALCKALLHFRYC